MMNVSCPASKLTGESREREAIERQRRGKKGRGSIIERVKALRVERENAEEHEERGVDREQLRTV
jgi:hypothetical protein